MSLVEIRRGYAQKRWPPALRKLCAEQLRVHRRVDREMKSSQENRWGVERGIYQTCHVVNWKRFELAKGLIE